MKDRVASFQSLLIILNCHIILSGRVAGNTQSNRGFHVSGRPMLKIMFRINSSRVAAQHYGENSLPSRSNLSLLSQTQSHTWGYNPHCLTGLSIQLP